MQHAPRSLAAIAAILILSLSIGCRQKQAPVTPPAPSPTPVPREGSEIPANTLFSRPGTYWNRTSEFVVTIERETQDDIRYTVMAKNTGVNPNYAVSGADLIMCWAEDGRLWSYDPRDFVSYRFTSPNRNMWVSVGTGARVRDEMPPAFRDSLPDDIEAMWESAKAASPNGAIEIPVDRD